MNSIPKLPDVVNKVLLIFAPIYAGFFGVIAILGVVTSGALLLHSGATMTEIFNKLNEKTGSPLTTFSLLITLVAGIIMFLSVSKLIKHQVSGWKLLLTAELILLVTNLFTNLVSDFHLLNLIFPLVVTYLILQLRSYYK